ncbi:helix-turn-helix domain-containing protein [Streptosporangium minutum]|nr:helix-turn-helix domain-containing protein [Streptosporangium minutum]
MQEQIISPAVLEMARALVAAGFAATSVDPISEPTQDDQERCKPYRVAEVARALDVHQSTVYREIESGRLKALRVGKRRGTLRIPVDAFNDYRIRLSRAAIESPDEVA